MTAYELYKALEKKFEEDPTTKNLPVNVVDNEWGEMEATSLKFRPKSSLDDRPMNMVVIE